MPESGQNSTGKIGGSDTLHSDCLPEYSPRPRYIITTIYPSSAESVSIEKRPEAISRVSAEDITARDEGEKRKNEKAIIPSPGQSGAIEGQPDWRRALTMPVLEAAIQSAPEFGTRVIEGERSPAEGAGMSVPQNGGKVTGDLKYIPKRGRKQGERSMELPRGRFQGVRRNVRLTFLLRDLSENRFTGLCRIIQNQDIMVLVLEKGTVILAGHGDLAGENAWDGILSCLNMPVDAQLNELNETQLNLALEFNPEWKVRRGYPGDSGTIPPTKEGEMLTRARSLSEAGFDHGALSSPGRDVPGPHILVPGIKDRADDAREGGKLATPTPASDESVEPPADESCKQETTDWKEALALPVIPMRDFSPPVQGGEKECIPKQKPVVAFEPLERDSALFETSDGVRERRLIQVPDIPEQWRLMSVNRRENLSV